MKRQTSQQLVPRRCRVVSFAPSLIEGGWSQSAIAGHSRDLAAGREVWRFPGGSPRGWVMRGAAPLMRILCAGAHNMRASAHNRRFVRIPFVHKTFQRFSDDCRGIMEFESIERMRTQVIAGQWEAAAAPLAITSQALKNYAHMRIYRITDRSGGQEQRFQETGFDPCENFEIIVTIGKTAEKRG